MAIRIECPHEGYKECWVDFKETGWTFGKRREIVQAPGDEETICLILDFVEDWNIHTEDNKPIKFEPEKGIDLFWDMDDRIIIPWFINAWFMARNERTEVQKNS